MAAGSTTTQKRRFFLYPEAIEASVYPGIPFQNSHHIPNWHRLTSDYSPASPPRPATKPNPAFAGWILLIAAFVLEWSGLIRQYIWNNAGFGSLRRIRELIEATEPRFDPTVFPLDDEQRSESEPETTTASNGHAAPSSSNKLAPLGQRHYTVADYREAYLSGALTPLDVAQTILPYIRRDTSPPGLHSIAWFSVKPDIILAAAKASTDRYARGESLGPLDGVPSAVKDEYDMDGYTTTLGSKNDYTGKKKVGSTVTRKGVSFNVQQMEAAGVVILGKVSMHEFGMDTSGNNPVHGTTTNPFHSGYYPGGSSGGSAYAVATGLIPIALGSDGGGSIRIPASYCSVYGLKPTHGRLSCKPGENHSNTCGVNGPIGSDIRSLAAFYSILSDPHPTTGFPARDPFKPSPTADTILFSSAPPPSAQRAKIIGVPEDWFARADPTVQALCRATISRLVQQKGYTVVPITIPFLHEGQLAHALTILTDAATLLPTHEPGIPRYKTEYSRLTAANKILLALGRTTPAADFLLAAKLRRVLMQHLAWLWGQHGADMVIVTPVSACAGWPIQNTDPKGGELSVGLSDGDRTLRTMEFVWLGNFCGIPGLAMPAGYTEDEKGNGGVAGEIVREGYRGGQGYGAGRKGKVPVGIMAYGEWCGEERLLRFGLDVEEVNGAEEMGVQTRPECWVDVLKEARERKGME